MRLADIKEVVYFVSHIVLDTGESKLLTKGDVLKEKMARIKFKEILKEIVVKIENKEDQTKAQDYIAKLSNPKEAFEFHVYSQFISRYTKARFGIGAEAIYELLKEIDINNEIKNTKTEITKTKSFFVGNSIKKKTIMHKLEKLA
jgi:DNA-directed RNA polymerase subunit beta'